MRRRVRALCRTPEVRLFLGLWLLHGLLVNSGDIEAFALQHAGIEAIVERHQLSVEGSPTPQLQPGGDVFEHDGHLYAAKQPGQFFAGALVYFVLHGLGLSYTEHYLLTGALNTFFSVSLVTAAAGVCVFRLASAWAPGGPWRWLALLSFSAGSLVSPYSGVMHHDALATAYLAIAFFLATRLADAPAGRRAAGAALATGLLLGATITTSMLPAPPVAVVGLYALRQRWRLWPSLTLGGALGLLPLFLYNWFSFGHPLLVPNLAGAYTDTFLVLDWGNFVSKLRFYGERLTTYVPVFWCGLAGLALFPARLRREQLTLACVHVALMAYVFNIETVGGCQFGPRYLLPLMPFAALGTVGFGQLASARRRRVALAAVGLVLAVSIAINLLGALYGAMHCDLRRYAVAHYLEAVEHGVFRSFPLALWLVVPIGLWFVPLAAAAAGRAEAWMLRTRTPGPAR